jgi:hypothetical protein
MCAKPACEVRRNDASEMVYPPRLGLTSCGIKPVWAFPASLALLFWKLDSTSLLSKVRRVPVQQLMDAPESVGICKCARNLFPSYNSQALHFLYRPLPVIGSVICGRVDKPGYSGND